MRQGAGTCADQSCPTSCAASAANSVSIVMTCCRSLISGRASCSSSSPGYAPNGEPSYCLQRNCEVRIDWQQTFHKLIQIVSTPKRLAGQDEPSLDEFLGGLLQVVGGGALA